MEKGFESWFQNQKIDPNSLSTPFGLHHRPNIPCLGNMLSPNTTNRKLPMFTFEATKPEEHSGWFYGLPPYCQGFTPGVNSIPKNQLPEPRGPHEVQKKFLVFDQSNDRTTLIYTSPPIQYHLPKKEISLIEKHEDKRFSNRFLDDGNNEVSEMREDTEELKALLYSDDDNDIDYSEDEEEQSTGHSPNLMTGFVNHNAEEVSSSTGCRKRHTLDTGGYDEISLEDTASSGKSGVNCSGEAEFNSCRDNSGARIGVLDVELDSFRAGKRARKEKVRETINILQNLIPGGKNGKDAMVIIDEAINYLRILKVKAKALGLDSL